MLLTPTRARPYWETLLILGRVSNLPTVWSNCLAGWILGGGGSVGTFLVLGLGASCIYLGGMFLNDAFDVEFDKLHRKERPIPSGGISLDEVWRWGFAWLGTGTVLLVLLGNATGAFAALLLFSIILYDAVHKLVALSPLLMGACRLFLYLVAASAADRGVTGPPIWSGLALAVYITGLGYLARHEHSKTGLPLWPAWLLTAPIVLALLANAGEFRTRALILSVTVALWVFRSLRPAFWAEVPHMARSVAGLLAGIILTDLLALAGGVSIVVSLAFIALFGIALVGQRYVPAS